LVFRSRLHPLRPCCWKKSSNGVVLSADVREIQNARLCSSIARRRRRLSRLLLRVGGRLGLASRPPVRPESRNSSDRNIRRAAFASPNSCDRRYRSPDQATRAGREMPPAWESSPSYEMSLALIPTLVVSDSEFCSGPATFPKTGDADETRQERDGESFGSSVLRVVGRSISVDFGHSRLRMRAAVVISCARFL